MTIRRFSSRLGTLDSFLKEHLVGAKAYKRIAGYFTSSLFEVAGELLYDIPDVKIVCNSDIHPEDLQVAQVREAKMIGRWNEKPLAAEALYHKQRYSQLDRFLQKHGQVVRVAPDDICGFLHGKAGVITRADGQKVGFIGSMNETRNGWQNHYEILWEDTSAEGILWIEEEFEYLWQHAKELPRVVIQEIVRRGKRQEITFEELEEVKDIAPAALIESPLYREGASLQPWQQGFLTEVLRHYNNHGCVRLLLADEVGLGKTLSLGTAALTLCLLPEYAKQANSSLSSNNIARAKPPISNNMTRVKPVAIFAPATLCEQWQTEMFDKLDVPCARWDTQKKVWLDHKERAISPQGAKEITRCPWRIGIISTGLMMRDSDEKKHLLEENYGLVILDEAHKARSARALGEKKRKPNNLLCFMQDIARRADHVLLGTATPIQTAPEDLWDLMRILAEGKGAFVLGDTCSKWRCPEKVLPILSGKEKVTDLEDGWELLRAPLPLVDSTDEPNARKLLDAIRQDLDLGKKQTECRKSLATLPSDTRECLEEELEREINGTTFFQRENPLIRHIVLRKRVDLEEKKLLRRIGVILHPDKEAVKDENKRGFTTLFEGKALRTSQSFQEAYEAACLFGKALSHGKRKGGFMKSLMEQRICSSIYAGLKTARMLLEGKAVQEETEEEETDGDLLTFKLEENMPEEKEALQRLIEHLEDIEENEEDPKLKAILYFLEEENWLKNYGVIIFSQYYDTAQWVADSLAARYPDYAVGLYAGATRSKLYKERSSVGVEREVLKKMVAEHQIKLMVATDAACEGLNLQTLGALINIDLPWNPTRLEQRIGRIKRFGQRRDEVDMLNLVNAQTVDEKVYNRLSERMRDRFDLFGSLPDTIKDEWIEDIETLDEKMDEYIKNQKEATGFDLRYRATAEPKEQDWRDCAKVLSRRDFSEFMRKSWKQKI